MAANPANWIGDARQYIGEVRNESMAGTVGVLVVVTVLTLGLSVVDLGLGFLVRLILPS